MMAEKSEDELRPEELLHFIETNEFMRRWASLGMDAERDLWDLQDAIMRRPFAGKVVPGTGILRKMRYGRAGDRIGKRGGLRVCYVLFPEHGIALLVTAYGKNQKGDLSAAEKRQIRGYIERTKAVLDSRKRDGRSPDG